MRIVYKGNYIRMTCGEIGLVVLYDFLLNVKAVTLIFISVRGSAISSAK